MDIGSHIISDTEETAPQTIGEVFSTLDKLQLITGKTSIKLKKAVGFRNVAIHNYEVLIGR